MRIFTFHLFHHTEPDREVLARLDAINRKLDLIIKDQEFEMAELDDLTAQVAANKTVIDSALALIGGIADRIAKAGTDPAKLSALTASLKAEDDALAMAVAANTLAAPAPGA